MTTLTKSTTTVSDEDTTTNNGDLTYSTSLNANVDLFFQIGAARGQNVSELFEKALNEDRNIALRILLWARDIRGGAGERQVFRSLMIRAMNSLDGDKEAIQRFVDATVEVGRWDDLITLFFNTDFEYYALRKIRHGLIQEQNGLCAKWMPRPKSGLWAKNAKGEKIPNTKKRLTNAEAANKIRKFLHMTPKEYRKLLVSLSNTVEQKMCAQEWKNIDYEKLPSLAQARYSNAFMKHDPTGYGNYLESLQKDEAKVNTQAVYPYDVIKTLNRGNSKMAESMWKNLPDYLDGSDRNILPLVDVSGSMGALVGGNSNVTCMDVAVSLGLYLSERNEGAFKNRFMTFSSTPKINILSGTLSNRYNSLSRADWGFSTDLGAAFDQLLNVSVSLGISQDEMPSDILILSDMQFNGCVKNANTSAHKAAKARFAQHGYELPNIIFWNLHAHMGQSPVRFSDAGYALVSGFSPSIMTAILSGNDLTPVSIMEEAIMKDRYAVTNN